MNPSVTGWLRAYCENRTQSIARNAALLEGSEEVLYRMLQPTGLMYGHPVKHPGSLDIESWDSVEKMKLIYAESLFQIATTNLGLNPEEPPTADLTEHLVTEVNDYFLNIYPHLYQGKLTSSLEDPFYLAETLITKRLTVKTSLLKNYLANLFHNSLLFLDVYYFGKWIKGMGSASSRRLREEKEAMRLAILEVMALAAFADDSLQKEERALFEFFLHSAGLSPEKQIEARQLLNSRVQISDIHIPPVESWILRKYLLEMAILITWADKDMSAKEQEMIDGLGLKLGFTTEDASSSILAVESFVLANWEGMHYLLGKHNMERVGNRFVRRLKSFINKNKDYVVQEVKESKELVTLLGKSRRTTLTESEKRVVNKQLMDILKTIPTFVIIALPFTFITLPIMISLLPPSAFPSAFQE